MATITGVERGWLRRDDSPQPSSQVGFRAILTPLDRYLSERINGVPQLSTVMRLATTTISAWSVER